MGLRKSLYLLGVVAVFAWGQSVKMVVTLSPVEEVFRTQQQTFVLSTAPAIAPIQVFVNGVRMLSGEDYTITDSQLQFTGQSIGENPIIIVDYWRLQ